MNVVEAFILGTAAMHSDNDNMYVLPVRCFPQWASCQCGTLP